MKGLAIALCAAAGCAATGPASVPAGPAAPAPEDAAAYFPLTPGWKWAYTVEKGGDRMLATYAVLERLGDTAIVQAGEQRLGYAVLPAGIARREGLNVGDFLLRTPVRLGARWPLAGGEAKVSEFGRTVTVPGGTFPGCATVEESRTDPQRVVRTVYAAGVGPILLEVQVQDPASGQFRTDTRAALVGVTRPGEDPLGPPEGVSVPPRGGSAARSSAPPASSGGTAGAASRTAGAPPPPVPVGR
jgi:hypothetical protein